MNKELIKKYKKEFEYWLNGGQILHKDEVDNWKISKDIWDLKSERISAIVINDEYVEFRKALAEGITVQYYVDGFVGWQDVTSLNQQCMHPNSFRIKPGEHKFKIGDWITDGFEVWQHKENCRVKNQTGWSLWKPKPGEWCWVYNYLRGIPNLRRVIRVEDNFINRFDDENFTKAVRVSRGDYLDDEVGYRFCEPFIGQLPSNLK